MARFKTKQGNPPARKRIAQRALLGNEIELIMRERERLLRTAGAAAALFSSVELGSLPRRLQGSVLRLGALLDELPDETLGDALRSLHGARRSPVRRAGMAV